MEKKIKFSNVIAWQLAPNKKFAYTCNLKTRQYFQFEDTAMMMWLCIADSGPIDCKDLVSKVASYYKVEKNMIEDDVNEFLNSLYEEGLIEYDE